MHEAQLEEEMRNTLLLLLAGTPIVLAATSPLVVHRPDPVIMVGLLVVGTVILLSTAGAIWASRMP
jgi:hypothetical protein